MMMNRAPAGLGRRQPADLLDALTPDLVSCLADLHGAPEPLAQAMIQLLPFGSRTALEALDLAVWRESRGGEEGERRLELTAAGFEVIAVAAARGDQREVAELARRAREVASGRCGS